MLKRQDIKLNSSGKVSCLLLLLLAFLMINPITTPASALEAEEDANYDGQISTQADSGVAISFTPSSGSASLTPTTSDGASAKINVSANIKIASTGGYTIYLGANNSALTGAASKQTIPAATTATTFANMKTNTWGYAYAEGSSVPDTATYSALPQGQGTSLESKSGNQTNVNKTYAISFATKIGNDKPADVYSNQATLSVTSSPLQVTWDTMTEMQQMTTAICDSVSTPSTSITDVPSKQLKDTRDGKYYWVSKLADGRCWMTQNLDLDLSTSKTLTSNDSDVASWTPEYSTATTASDSTILLDNSGQRSWSLGNYRITNPTVSSNCGYPKNNVSQCTSQFTAYNTPTTANSDANAHYIIGNHYQWSAATAGANGSICPKGWQLPESSSTAAGTFGGLVNTYSIKTSVTKLTSAPLYFVRGGYVSQTSSGLFMNAGSAGHYWSSTPNTNGKNAYSSSFYNADGVSSVVTTERSVGYSVRCVAR